VVDNRFSILAGNFDTEFLRKNKSGIMDCEERWNGHTQSHVIVFHLEATAFTAFAAYPFAIDKHSVTTLHVLDENLGQGVSNGTSSCAQVANLVSFLDFCSCLLRTMEPRSSAPLGRFASSSIAQSKPSLRKYVLG
jgi:hypothetical protein